MNIESFEAIAKNKFPYLTFAKAVDGSYLSNSIEDMYQGFCLAALSAVPAELSSNPLQLQIAFNEWISKTDFVQKDEHNLFYKCLGMHRADAMRSVIESQASRIASLEENLAICSSAHSKVSIEVESLRKQLARADIFMARDQFERLQEFEGF